MNIIHDPGRETYAVVVGGINIDIGGKSDAPIIAGDSNPGKVTVSLGGVGRNIAHNMALLKMNVRMLTAFGDDSHALQIEASCAELGIDITRARKIPGGRTSTYLFLDDCGGDMVMAVSDMKICEEITPEYLETQIDLINHASLVVADANIPAESLSWLAERCTVPIFADPVSTIKAVKLRPILGKIHTLKPNRMEAELLSGVRITDDDTLKQAAEVLLETGLKRVFISLGSHGVYAADHDQAVKLPCCRAVQVNATGAGDAFMAGLAWSFSEGKNLEESARIGSAAAALAIESELTINSAMSPETVRKKREESVQ